MNEERLVGQEQVAEFLGASEKTLEGWRHRGEGPPFIRVGRLCRYRMRDVWEWLESRRVQSTSQVMR